MTLAMTQSGISSMVRSHEYGTAKPRVWKYGRSWWALARMEQSNPLTLYRARFPTWEQAVSWALKPTTDI